MSFRFIYGPGGSGKSHFIYEECIKRSLEHPERMFYILVPEQSTLSTQQQLFALHPGHGSVNIDVIGFTTLAYRVIEELHIPTKKMIDDSGKMLLMRRAVLNVSKDLKILKYESEKTGFLDDIVHTLGEMASFGLFESDSSLQALLEDSEHSPLADHYILRQKLSDLERIWKSYRKELADRFMDKDELMPILCKALPAYTKRVPIEIYLDGFNGFTPLQYQVITHLMLNALRVSIALCAKKGTLTKSVEGDLFASAASIYARLMDTAERERIMIEPEVSVGENEVYRLRDNDELSHLEQNYEQTQTPIRWEHACKSIQLYRLDHPTMEVSMVVRTIRDLVYRAGYRFSDIAVVTGQTDRFRDIIAREFERAEIPYFTDTTRDMTDSDYTNFVLSLLNLLTGGFRMENVLGCLKYGYVIKAESLDLLENHIIAHGIDSYRRFARLAAEEIDDETHKSAKNVFEVLGPFYETYHKGKHTASQYFAGIAEVLNACRASDTVQERIDFLNSDGKYDRAAEYKAVQEKLQNLFAQTQSLMSEDLLNSEELEKLLTAGLENMKIGVIPPTLDRVIIGQLRRMRIGHIKALFMIGVNDGLFPLVAQGGGLINDVDRELLLSMSVELSPSSARDSMNDKLYLYQMFTTPSEKIYISYSSMDSQGEALLPSYVIGQLKNIFTKLTETKELPKNDQALLNPNYCIDWISKKEDVFGQYYRALYRWYREDPRYTGLLCALQSLSEYTYVHKPLSEQLSRSLFEKNHSLSPSRLERFGSCAFRHFLDYGLRLKERKEAAIDTIDQGSFYHFALQFILEEMTIGNDREVSEWSEERERETVQRAIRYAYEKEPYLSDKMEDNGYHQFLAGYWEKEIGFLIKVLRAQIAYGDFTKFYSEVPFGNLPDESRQEKPHLAAVNIPETDCVIRGKIDRVDTTKDGEIVRVIDYKTGNREIDFALLSEGAQLQLPIYLAAVLKQRRAEGKLAKPVGVYYFHASEPLLSADDATMEASDDDREDIIFKKLLDVSRMTGLSSAEKDVLEHQERGFEARLESRLIKGLKLTKDSHFYSTAQVLTTEEFDRFSDHVLHTITGLYKKMMCGYIAVSPLKSQKSDVCTYCPYASVCHINDKQKGMRKRKVGSLSFKDYMEQIREEDAQKQNGNETPEKGE